MYTIPSILICIVVQHFLAEQRCVFKLRQSTKLDSVFDIKPRFPAGRSASVKTIQQLPDLFSGLDGIFELITGELKLITKVWQSSTLDNLFYRDKSLGGRSIWRADAEDMAH